MHSFLFSTLIAWTAAAPIPVGAGQQVVAANGQDITVHTYRPANVTPKALILVFHGTNRNASEYRDWGKPLAEQMSAVVAAPEFDSKRFTNADYHRGGLLDRTGRVRPKNDWTWQRVPEIAKSLKADLHQPDLPVYLIGHSAGGQFLHRLAAFTDPGAKAIIAANAGTLLFPTHDAKYSLGFGGLPDELAGDAQMKHYLAAPLVLYQGTADTATTIEQDKHLDVSPEAKKQGACRYERGHNLFKAGEKLAKEKGWKFNWRIVDAPGVGHSAEEMFKHPNCRQAFGLGSE
jgi:poly(3-hydroxybutyrate) depolymerase